MLPCTNNMNNHGLCVLVLGCGHNDEESLVISKAYSLNLHLDEVACVEFLERDIEVHNHVAAFRRLMSLITATTPAEKREVPEETENIKHN